MASDSGRSPPFIVALVLSAFASGDAFLYAGVGTCQPSPHCCCHPPMLCCGCAEPLLCCGTAAKIPSCPTCQPPSAACTGPQPGAPSGPSPGPASAAGGCSGTSTDGKCPSSPKCPGICLFGYFDQTQIGISAGKSESGAAGCGDQSSPTAETESPVDMLIGGTSLFSLLSNITTTTAEPSQEESEEEEPAASSDEADVPKSSTFRPKQQKVSASANDTDGSEESEKKQRKKGKLGNSSQKKATKTVPEGRLNSSSAVALKGVSGKKRKPKEEEESQEEEYPKWADEGEKGELAKEEERFYEDKDGEEVPPKGARNKKAAATKLMPLGAADIFEKRNQRLLGRALIEQLERRKLIAGGSGLKCNDQRMAHILRQVMATGDEAPPLRKWHVKRALEHSFPALVFDVVCTSDQQHFGFGVYAEQYCAVEWDGITCIAFQ